MGSDVTVAMRFSEDEYVALQMLKAELRYKRWRDMFLDAFEALKEKKGLE